MRLAHLALAIGLSLGIGGAAAAASPLAPNPAHIVAQPGVAVDYVKRKGWRGHRGHHYGWRRGRHYGWRHRPRRVYYAPYHHRRVYYAPRRHHGYYGYHRPRPRVYIGF